MQRAKPPREPLIRTKRLTLRLPAMGDLDDMVAEIDDFDIAKMTTRIPHPYRREDGIAFLNATRQDAATGRGLNLAVVHDGRLIGICALFSLPYQPEVGYWFGRAHWGRGLATEAAEAVVAFGFEVLDLPLIRCGAFADNPASSRVQTKLGFQRIGRRHVHSLARGAKVEHLDAVLTPTRFRGLHR